MKAVKKIKKVFLLWRDIPAREFLGVYSSERKAMRAMAKLEPTVTLHNWDRDSMGNIAIGLWRVTGLKVDPKYWKSTR